MGWSFIDVVCSDCKGEGCTTCMNTGLLGKIYKRATREARGDPTPVNLRVTFDSSGNASHDFGSIIRKTREDRQVSMRDLADYAGMSVPRLSDIERGIEAPNSEERKKLEDWLQ